MFAHIYGNCGIITAIDLNLNKKYMDAPYSPTSSIEEYFNQFETIVEYAEAGNSLYNANQIATKAFL